MRILILNEYFYPDVASTAQHCSDLARALVREGHEVTVLTGRHSYEAGGRLLPRRETWEGVRILRVSSLKMGKTARWERGAHFASFLAACSWRLLWLRSYDSVIAMTTPPLFSLLGALFTRIKGGRLFVWMMDLNPDEAVAAGWLKAGGLPHRFMESLLRYSLKHSGKIVVLDQFMEERIVAKGVEAGTVMVLPPWSHDGEVKYDPQGRNEFRQRNGLEGKFVVMYSGNHSPCHPLDTLLEAADRIHRGGTGGTPIVFCFVGGGSETSKVKEFVRAYNLPNVVCLPYQPVEKLAASLSAADLHVVVMGDPFVGIVHPCKIYNILRIGVPFLYIGPSQSHITDILPPGGSGGWAHVFPHGSAESVAACIQQCAQAGRRQFEEEMLLAQKFSSDRLVPRMIASLEMTAESGQRKTKRSACVPELQPSGRGSSEGPSR
jgi:glycosyltransferase involved in cell wall biosynthesis